MAMIFDFDHGWNQHMIFGVGLAHDFDGHAYIIRQGLGIGGQYPSVTMHQNTRRYTGHKALLAAGLAMSATGGTQSGIALHIQKLPFDCYGLECPGESADRHGADGQ